MIFVTLGSQKFQFNRLLKAVDELISKGKIEDEVFAQIGYSDYIPRNYAYKEFMDREEFSGLVSKCDIVITHGGTGAIIGAIKKGKKVIAIPRLAQYGEHVDDHQLQLINEFKEQKLICGLDDCSSLAEAIELVKTQDYIGYRSNTDIIINSIDDFIKAL